jgi:hypothetical protein
MLATEAPKEATQESAAIWRATRSFVQWLDDNGVESHDPYDLWGTWYGLLARRAYYRKHPLGTFLVSPLVVSDVLMPGASRLLIKKQRFATAEAQLALAFLNLYRLTRDDIHLKSATKAVEGLLELSIPGYRGHCWGYPFDWQNHQGLWPRNTPFITATPYCFEAFIGIADATGDQRFLDVAASIARFVADDLRDSETRAGASAGSYSPNDGSKVINASAYRAFVLFESWRRFGRIQYRRGAERNLQFVFDTQRADGSWLYAIDSPGEAFIDHFHTCFVLKNLVKLNRVIANSQVNEAVHRGFAFYNEALFHPSGMPKSFAIEPRLQLARLEMYNVAESITLGTLLKSFIPEAFDRAKALTKRLIDKYQLPDGHFVTRTYMGGVRHTTPFLRWPQAQLFLALTNMLVAFDADGSGQLKAAREPHLSMHTIGVAE